jgi:Zn-dependent protease with chaperone function
VAHTITISPAFRKQVSSTIRAIISFIIVYLILVLLALAFAGASAYAGFAIIVLKPSLYTLLAGAGLVIMGFLVFIFLVKFLFSTSKTDTSGLIQITQSDAPELFTLIDSIAEEVGTSKPRKVFLSQEVNAYVFYDSSFWSMFLPIKKNLTIGLGLVNSVTVSEFKAIMAHEFGHFSQKSMKIGSYTYHVNKILYNMLYDNEGYNRMIELVSNWHSFITFFSNIAVHIVNFFQKILRALYNRINISYMALSREMEFHADEVAASVTGSAPFISGLLRIELADNAFNTTVNYYNMKISSNIRTNQFFSRQRTVLEYLGKEGKHPIINQLPILHKEDISRYNKSKLILNNQWASHPSIIDRVTALEQLNLPAKDLVTAPAFTLIPNTLEERVTQQLFSTVNYDQEPQLDTPESFTNDFLDSRYGADFPAVFNKLYNEKHPGIIPINTIASQYHAPDQLFGNTIKDLLQEQLVLANDLQVLQQLQENPTDIPSFDYEGRKYASTDCASLIEELKQKQEIYRQQLAEHDTFIYAHCLFMEQEKGLAPALHDHYQTYLDIDKETDEQANALQILREKLEFISHQHPYNEIVERLELVQKQEEAQFKETLGVLLVKEPYCSVLTEKEKAEINEYLQASGSYFENNVYNEDQLKLLFNAINIHTFLLSRAFYEQKKRLLDYMASLLN